MPKFLEDKLKREYPNNPGAVYGTLNAIGAMHGNKVTDKGRAMEAKHIRDVKAGKASSARPMWDVKTNHPHKNLGGYLHPKKAR